MTKRAQIPKGTLFRMKTVTGLPKDVDLGRNLFLDVVSGCCRSVDGFVAGYFLVDRRSGRTVTLSLWSDETALQEGLRNLRDRLKGDGRAAATAAKVNARGVRFDTFELAYAIERNPGKRSGRPSFSTSSPKAAVKSRKRKPSR